MNQSAKVRIDALLAHARRMTVQTPALIDLVDRSVRLGELIVEAMSELSAVDSYEQQVEARSAITDVRTELVESLTSELHELTQSRADGAASLTARGLRDRSTEHPLLDGAERSAIADAIRSLGVSGGSTPGPLEAIVMALGSPGHDASLATTSEASCYAVQRCADALESIAELLRARSYHSDHSEIGDHRDHVSR